MLSGSIISVFAGPNAGVFGDHNGVSGTITGVSRDPSSCNTCFFGTHNRCFGGLSGPTLL